MIPRRALINLGVFFALTALLIGYGALDLLRGHLPIVDRRAAIATAIGAAREGDVVLIAGKGHEDYQIVGRTKVPFDDREEARAAASELRQASKT